jgi:hypothetical protein
MYDQTLVSLNADLLVRTSSLSGMSTVWILSNNSPNLEVLVPVILIFRKDKLFDLATLVDGVDLRVSFKLCGEGVCMVNQEYYSRELYARDKN